jgi:hypothetical protein
VHSFQQDPFLKRGAAVVNPFLKAKAVRTSSFVFSRPLALINLVYPFASALTTLSLLD